MVDFLLTIYPWVKSLHIMSVISWMAGLFYLPRLFVYHVEEVGSGSDTDLLFQKMESKLLNFIMKPAMYSTWIFGLLLVFTPGMVDWSNIWPWTKGIGIIGMTWFHIWLSQQQLNFVIGQNIHSGRKFRLMNEVPTLLMIVIVISVVLKF